MRLQRINYAEAIIEPFYDGSDSNRPANKIAQLSHYRVACSDERKVTAYQLWCGAQIIMNSGEPAWIELERDCDLCIDGFDVFRVFGAIPAAARQTIRAKIDGTWQTICDAQPGTDATEELDYPISGKCLEKLVIRLEQDGKRDCAVLYEWLGLSNRQREADMLALKSEFTPDWPDMLREDGGFEPRIGMMFDAAELEAIRARVREEPLKPLYEKMRKEAEEKLSWQPERDIGEYVPHPDKRWVRARDRDKPDTSYVMQVMAFVGLIEKDARMMKMAVRMALSAVHCGQWTESIMGALPGCAWHHRSFTEENYCRGCALVLDWAGSWLTSYGQEAVVDALVMKGLPRLESDFKRQEYIRGMNQGIVFSSGRVLALLACAHYYPRYRSMVLEAEQDLHEMIGNYILPDGGTPEGPTYWNFTFVHAMPILRMLARFHGSSLDAVRTPELEKTSRYALSLLSVSDDGACVIPINDAHSGHYEPQLMAAFYALTGREEFAQLTALSLKNGDADPTLDLFIMAPDHLPKVERLVQQGFVKLPDIGQTRIIRPDEACGQVSLSFFTGLADVGHFHMDKGSFVLETERERLLIDRGGLAYTHPDTLLVQMPEYHNLLFPELSGKRPRQKPTREGAYLVDARYENGRFEAVGDITRAWNDRRILKDIRKITSDSARTYLIEDEMELSEEAPVAFLLHTTLPCEREANGMLLRGNGETVRIQPNGWTPEQIDCSPLGVDSRGNTAWRITLRSGSAKRHHLLTSITIE